MFKVDFSFMIIFNTSRLLFCHPPFSHTNFFFLYHNFLTQPDSKLSLVLHLAIAHVLQLIYVCFSFFQTAEAQDAHWLISVGQFGYFCKAVSTCDGWIIRDISLYSFCTRLPPLFSIDCTNSSAMRCSNACNWNKLYWILTYVLDFFKQAWVYSWN